MKPEKKLELKDDNPIWIHKKVEDVFQELYDHYRAINSRNEYLSKEIAKVKEETYKDNELTEMKKKYDEMSADYYRGFPISEAESQKISAWMKEVTEGEDPREKVGGAISGRFKYEFIPTSIGVIGTVIDTFTNKKLTFQEP